MITLGLAFTALAAPWTGDGQPLKYVSSCELDLDQNGAADIVMLVETVRGRELVALLTTDAGFDAHVIERLPASNGMHLRCSLERTLVASVAADNGGEAHETPGGYIELFKPESGSRSFYWRGDGFVTVVTGD
ncbi:MAG: hypothetical protein R3F61_25035 [Myxococcota bacterium]